MHSTHQEAAALGIAKAIGLLPGIVAQSGERAKGIASELRNALLDAQAHLNNSLFLTTEELAKRWRCSPGNLENWRIAGKGPCFTRPGGKTRGRVLYPIAEIERWERDNEFSSTTECQASGAAQGGGNED